MIEAISKYAFLKKQLLKLPKQILPKPTLVGQVLKIDAKTGMKNAVVFLKR